MDTLVFASEVLPGVIVVVAAAKQAAETLKENGIMEEVLVVLAVFAAIGLPSAGVIIWRAGLHKLDERFMDKVAFTKLKADVDNEMSQVRTSHQTLLGKWEALDEKVSTIINDERHRELRLGRIEQQMTAAIAQLHKLEIDQLSGFGVLKDEIRGHVDTSIAGALREIREMVNQTRRQP